MGNFIVVEERPTAGEGDVRAVPKNLPDLGRKKGEAPATSIKESGLRNHSWEPLLTHWEKGNRP